MQRCPASFFRQAVRTVCLFCGLAVLALSLQAQHKGNRLRPRYLSDEADPARGVEIMAQFRSLGIAGDYYLDFDLHVLPRRGEASVVKGRMWGSRNAIGPLFRAELRGPDTRLTLDRLLGQNGPQPQSWRFSPPEIGGTSTVEALDPTTLLDPLAGTGLSMFELQMPFTYWDDFVFEGVTQVRGRAVHAFLMYPPDEFAAAHPEIGGVRLHLDANFNALMQAVILDGDEEPLRKLTVLDLKKLGEQWIVKSIDVRDEATRDKVRFEVNGAALGLSFAPGLFTPTALQDNYGPPDGVEFF
ncbi:hypothetical protein [Actomonas aquatica]|uniref:Outer membrane lipoprotein-sorting protein n=1 Tax=Actomonas aquatica TaxID=2866162 RepID=A0ABZ1C9D0_9BACT|nr:hypothetical protein [Opitutus sp. WL0086]WRQ88204.1 hypothetical protein K1X11_002215 [Opitutus sp. WL0086]